MDIVPSKYAKEDIESAVSGKGYLQPSPGNFCCLSGGSNIFHIFIAKKGEFD